ncbi:hypothetical protein GQ54DRAFT_198863 [Martensiomyces pterosporus]|nr:hypothetical protein GQ54DRAFT_198863 [Martensiomyces pterosporus]
MGRGKYTAQEALEALPEPTLECPVVRVLGPRGQHLHEVAIASSLVSSEINGRLNADKKDWFTTLVQLPPKFRSVVWVKRGSYVLADLSEQLTDKIGGEVALVLMADQVKHLKQNKQWPNQYDDLWDEMASGQDPAAARCDDDEDNSNREKGSDEDEENADSDMDDELMMGGGNPNRRHMSSDEDDSSDEE